MEANQVANDFVQENNRPPTELEVIQRVVHEWRQRNFPDADATQQLLGVAEELGELSHSHLKEMQGIRGDSGLHQANAKDAVGDLMIYLMGYCSCRGWDIRKILIDTADHVLKRDWIANPEDGDVALATDGV